MLSRRKRKRNIRTAGFLGIEKKFYDTSLVGGALTAPTDVSGGEHNPSATICLNSVTQGDGESQRDGRQIAMKSVHLKGQIRAAKQANQIASDQAGTYFIAVVQDTQTNGALLNSEDVFVNPAANANTATSLWRNLQFEKRFRVLWKKRGALRDPNMVWDGTNIEQGGYEVPFEANLALRDMKVNYSGTTETIANITDNSLSVVAFAGSSVDLAPLLDYNARLRFVG